MLIPTLDNLRTSKQKFVKQNGSLSYVELLVKADDRSPREKKKYIKATFFSKL